jgi:hypothetical protein
MVPCDSMARVVTVDKVVWPCHKMDCVTVSP